MLKCEVDIMRTKFLRGEIKENVLKEIICV